MEASEMGVSRRNYSYESIHIYGKWIGNGKFAIHVGVDK